MYGVNIVNLIVNQYLEQQNSHIFVILIVDMEVAMEVAMEVTLVVAF